MDSKNLSVSSSVPSLTRIKHRPIKRIFDIFFSLAALICLAPVMVIISLLIALSSPGQVIFGHERVGRGGRSFRCYKFRTMYKNADERLKELLDQDPERRQEWEQTYKLKNDPRVTPIGKFLRQTSLDELPQFWNVLIGDLSVVGPRPVVAQELSTFFGNKAEKILTIRPGITGLWQVSGRSDISYTERIQLDEVYVDNHSLWFDIVLIMKTVYCLLSRKGAY